MAVPERPFTGDGSTRSWAISFPFIHGSHVKASVDGVLVSVVVTTGLVTLAGGVTTPPLAAVGRIWRETPTAQLSTFLGSTLNDSESNRIGNLQAMYLAEEREGGVRVLDGPLTPLANAVTRALKIIGFDANGDATLLSAVPTAGVAASSFWQTVLPAASALAARTALNVLKGDWLTAQGDLLTRDGSDYKRLPRGVTGQVLGVTGSDLAWQEGGVPFPQGRLTLASGVPILDADDLANTSVLFTPFQGNRVPLWNSTLSKFVARDFSELTNVLADSSTGKAGPAAAVAAKVYTMLVWDDAGVTRLTRSPAWVSNTDPGTGAGTAQTSYVQGIEVNAVAITNGPAAGAGTVVGWVMTNDGDANIDFKKGGTGANGSAAWIGITNKYNRVRVSKLIGDTTNSYTYSTATWRAANASNSMRVTIVRGSDYCPIHARYSNNVATAVAGAVGAAVGKDSTSAPSGIPGVQLLSGTNLGQQVSLFTDDAIGKHFYQALEIGTAAGTTTFYGDNGAAYQSSGLVYEWEF